MGIFLPTQIDYQIDYQLKIDSSHPIFRSQPLPLSPKGEPAQAPE
jgi:hypothetical protein